MQQYRHTLRKLESDAEAAMPTYDVNIEGQIYEWDQDSITAAELRELAGYQPDQQLIEIDLQDNTETVLPENAVVALKPGKGFAKKVEFKRG
jgi:hypothetical protein